MNQVRLNSMLTRSILYIATGIYNKESTAAGIAEIIIGKQRNGPIGTVKLAFQSNYSRFMNLSQDDIFNLYG